MIELPRVVWRLFACSNEKPRQIVVVVFDATFTSDVPERQVRGINCATCASTPRRLTPGVPARPGTCV